MCGLLAEPVPLLEALGKSGSRSSGAEGLAGRSSTEGPAYLPGAGSRPFEGCTGWTGPPGGRADMGGFPEDFGGTAGTHPPEKRAGRAGGGGMLLEFTAPVSPSVSPSKAPRPPLCLEQPNPTGAITGVLIWDCPLMITGSLAVRFGAAAALHDPTAAASGFLTDPAASVAAVFEGPCLGTTAPLPERAHGFGPEEGPEAPLGRQSEQAVLDVFLGESLCAGCGPGLAN
jgi:hypothetical protein